MCKNSDISVKPAKACINVTEDSKEPTKDFVDDKPVNPTDNEGFPMIIEITDCDKGSAKSDFLKSIWLSSASALYISL